MVLGSWLWGALCQKSKYFTCHLGPPLNSEHLYYMCICYCFKKHMFWAVDRIFCLFARLLWWFPSYFAMLLFLFPSVPWKWLWCFLFYETRAQIKATIFLSRCNKISKSKNMGFSLLLVNNLGECRISSSPKGAANPYLLRGLCPLFTSYMCIKI